MEPSDSLIEVRGAGMAFDAARPSLQDVELTMRRGEFVSIVGPSGCGKSTLLRLIAGLREPTSGSVTVAGCHPNERHTRTSFVFQEPNLLPWRTVESNIRLPLEIDRRAARSNPDEEARLVTESIRLIGLSEHDARKRPRELSGGMKMRVSLARALVTQPELLLLDEPFAALDDILRQQLNEELQRLWTHQKWTALFVTHNVAEAVFLSQRVLVMSRSPGTFIAEIAVPFECPRSAELRASPEFARLCGEVSQKLRTAAGIETPAAASNCFIDQ